MKSKKHTTGKGKSKEKITVNKNEAKPRGINQEHKDQTRTGEQAQEHERLLYENKVTTGLAQKWEQLNQQRVREHRREHRPPGTQVSRNKKAMTHGRYKYKIKQEIDKQKNPNSD